VVWADDLIGRGPEKNYFLLAAYLALGALSVVATGFYLKRRGIDLGESGAIWLATVVISGGTLIFAWPLIIPVLIWNETVLSRLLGKYCFPAISHDDPVPPSNRPLSDEEKVQAMRELTKRSPR